MLNELISKLKSLFRPVEFPINYVKCPYCKGTGMEDVFIDCEHCDGYGLVDPIDAALIKQKYK